MGGSQEVIEVTLLDGSFAGAREVRVASADVSYRLYVVPARQIRDFRIHKHMSKPARRAVLLCPLRAHHLPNAAEQSAQHSPHTSRAPAVPAQHSPRTPRTAALPAQHSPRTLKMASFGAFYSRRESFVPFVSPTSRARRIFSRTNPSTTRKSHDTNNSN